jgi:hypothetical protein
MAVIIDEIVAEAAPPAPPPADRQSPASVDADRPFSMDVLRAELQRDAHRRMRIFTD